MTAGARWLRSRVASIEAVRRLYFATFGSYRRQWDHWAGSSGDARSAIAPGAHDPTVFDRSGAEVAERLRTLFPSGGDVLEVGCGMGRVMLPLAPHCREIHGVDVSPRMVRLAREHLRRVANARVTLGNGRDLAGFPDGRFDAVYAVYVLQHLEREHAARYLQEMARVVRPGGSVVFEVPNLLFPRNLRSFLASAGRARSFSVARTRFYTEAECVALAEGVGLTVTSVRSESEIFVVARRQTT